MKNKTGSSPWKKSRKYGDIYGGREKIRLNDNLFNRLHSLKRPNPNEKLPILIEDNPSRDFFFPISANEAEIAIKALPNEAYKGITHIWLRRFKKSEFESNKLNLAEIIWGSGVSVIIIYPFPKTMIMDFGSKKPPNRKLKEIEKWCSNLIKKDGRWILKWEIDNLREYFISHLLFHEVGHHIDWCYRNLKDSEEFANQYAIQQEDVATQVIREIEEKKE